MLIQLDPTAFAFARAEVDNSNFDGAGPGFWFCGAVRRLDCIDEERSQVTHYEDVSFKVYKILIDVKVRRDTVGEARVFRLTHASLIQIADDVVVDALRSEKSKDFRSRACNRSNFRSNVGGCNNGECRNGTAHALQQNVGQESSVLRLLLNAKRFDIDAPENSLFLPSDESIAKAMGSVRHAGNHAPVDTAQPAVLDDVSCDHCQSIVLWDRAQTLAGASAHRRRLVPPDTIHEVCGARMAIIAEGRRSQCVARWHLLATDGRLSETATVSGRPTAVVPCPGAEPGPWSSRAPIGPHGNPANSGFLVQQKRT